MTTFKIILEYDGTRYSGWQEQKNARTVMGEIRAAAQQVFGGASDPSRPGESTIVEIEAAAIEAEQDIIQFRIAGSHFLWRMVRRVVGALVKVGKGEISVEDFGKLLDGRCDAALDVAAWTAPASGLFLEEIRYNGGL